MCARNRSYILATEEVLFQLQHKKISERKQKEIIKYFILLSGAWQNDDFL